MDTRYFGTNLLTHSEKQANRCRPSTKAEDAYYEKHTPSQSGIPRIASVAAAVVFGFATIGLWLQ